jgi:ferredoxin
MARVNPRLADEIKKLGAFDLQACYSCGNCSAMCPLCEGEISFPRKMIRYSLLGMENRILSSAEPWLCYYCGECSETCPREADPGGLMMALRRYTIRRYSLGRIADLFYSAFSSVIAWITLSVIAVVLIVLFHNPNMNMAETEWLSFISLDHIHDAGLIVTGFVALMLLFNIVVMTRALKRNLPGERFDLKNLARNSVGALREILMQERFNTCEPNRKKRAAHMALFWGFMGMGLATVIVMGIDYSWWNVSRFVPFILGSVFGFITLLGTAYFIYLRACKKIESARSSHISDWIFLLLIAMTVLSGFIMVLFKYAGMPMAAYYSFAVHLVFTFDLLVSLPFTKFAHAIYRPIVLWLSGVK